MKKSVILSLLFFSFAPIVLAEEVAKDSLKVIDIEEIIVIGEPKENRKLREQPTAVTLLSQQDMQINQVKSIKNLTAIVPNIFVPDYGSKLTSAIYIRGIGSRINTPSVGLYVDNVPYIDKSAFDFNYSDIERIDVLRGPQGTLYGRNTMGGLIKVHTKSPLSYQGTDMRLSAGTYNNYTASVTHYHRISDRFAFSTGGFYGYSGGFLKNSYKNNKKTDRVNEAGGRARAIYFPTENLKIDLSANYEYSDQGGYAYFYTGAIDPTKESRAEYIGKISANDDSKYRRSLVNTGLNIEYQAQHVILSAVTGYQHIKDRMFLDQDFTELNFFDLTQKQKSNTLSEEIILKSKPGKNWQWTTGVFGFYQGLKTDAPVTFKKDGIEQILEKNVNGIFDGLSSKAPQMHLTVNDKSLLISDKFSTPVINGAVYHQSTFNNLCIKGLSFTAGLRMDYEKNRIKYNCSSAMDFDFDLSAQTSGRPPMNVAIHNMKAPATLTGKLSHDYFQLLPKFALQYTWKKSNNVYATASRGYRSGGYNIQMFSDLVRTELENSLKTTLLNREEMQKIRPMIEQYITLKTVDVKAEASYKPEYSWNYEIGSHLTLWQGRLWADLSAFYMDTKDQQVTRFVEESGLGRITVNAGKSRSYGAEAAIKAEVTEALSLNVSYGYTHAKFRDYETVDDKGSEINYKGNYVPFAPVHTFHAGAQYLFQIAPRHWLDQVQIDANYNGAGRIYWTEQNNASQSFYGTFNARISLNKGNGQIAFWGQNLLKKKYSTFYFESRGSGFMQKGRPIQFGVDIRCRF